MARRPESVAESTRSAKAEPSAEAEAARSAGLRHVSDTEPGIRRKARSKTFTYVNPDGSLVRDAPTLARIKSLVIPPAYTDVWICTKPNGHLQASGRDARGRKQYRYHPRWRQVRDQGKYARLLDFGRKLPLLRRRLARDLKRRELDREKVAAIVVSLLATTLVRVGNDEYARTNKSYGLTTLRNRHVKFLSQGRAQLHFRGKSGQEHEILLGEPRLVRLLRRCHELPGQQLFQYLDETGERHSVDSDLVNAYLREAMGDEFSAKDFRTWAGTTRALALLASLEPIDASRQSEIKPSLAGVVKQIASELGNTPAVCRSAYIHPCVFELWGRGELWQSPLTGCTHERKLELAALKVLARELETRR